MDGGASVIWALVRNGGTCRPAVVDYQWRQDGPAVLDASENSKQLICEGESTDARQGDGPPCSSGDAR